MQYSLGIDIGTTSISAAVINLDTKEQAKAFTIPYRYDIPTGEPDFSQQDAALIWDEAVRLVDCILEKYPAATCIGLTGQMHGILYVDQDGRAVSPLMNWQDQRADRLWDGQQTYCGRIRELTGEKIAPGYGLATHYYNLQNELVPASAHSFCSIMDYVGMQLTGRKHPLMHTSVAASFGLFDQKCGCFRQEAIAALGMTALCLPSVTDDFATLGHYKGIPVSVAIGDNQASFLGSMKDIESSVLVNMGTGSQISTLAQSSFAANVTNLTEATEIRPLVKDKYIVCGSALCGGASYALLEKFFREYCGSSQYDTMNRLAYETYHAGKAPLTVNPYFRGRRQDPTSTGSILGITTENFTPGQLVLGFLYGMCRELYDLLETELTGKKAVIASGNAIQRISVLKDILEEIFGLPVQISRTSEEASLGAALFGAAAAGILQDESEFKAFIHYESTK